MILSGPENPACGDIYCHEIWRWLLLSGAEFSFHTQLRATLLRGGIKGRSSRTQHVGLSNTAGTNYVNNGLHSIQVCRCQVPACWLTGLDLNGTEPWLILLVTPVLSNICWDADHCTASSKELKPVTLVFTAIHNDYKQLVWNHESVNIYLETLNRR